VIRLRPGHFLTHHHVPACLAYLGRLDEAREALNRLRSEFPEQFQRMQQKPSYRRPEDWELLTEGLRLAAGEET